jgi:hypothetical protein
MVVLAAVALRAGLPARYLAGDPAQPLGAAVAQVLAALLVPTLCLIPLDVLGGRVVVREQVGLATWLARWARGVGAQFATWAVAAAALLAGGRAGGVAGACAAFALVQLALLAGRPWLARLVAPMRLHSAAATAPGDAWLADAAQAAGLDPARVHAVEVADAGFTGGWTGAAGRTLLVPAHWARLARPALVAQLARRRALTEWGLHVRGTLGALAWNLTGFALVLGLAPGADAASAAGLVTAAAWMTLWSFAGALVLPTPARAAVYAADAAAALRVGRPAVRDAVTALDHWQDDEAERPPAVETVFHPVPARIPRLRRLADHAPGAAGAAPAWAAHAVARHALYLAWGGLSPLARAVHCNVGRPALWVFWPGD